MKQFLKKVGIFILWMFFIAAMIVFTHVAYNVMDYYNIGADNS